MSTLIILLLAMAIFHFVYDGIILPSLRLKLRFELFALRDEIRRLRSETKGDDKAFLVLQESVNLSIRILPRATLSTFVKATKQMHENVNLRKTVEERIAIIDRSTISELKTIRSKTADVVMKAIGANSLPLLVYMLPVTVVFVVISMVVSRIKKLIDISRNIPLYPESEVEKVISPGLQPAKA